jgi:sortase B
MMIYSGGQWLSIDKVYQEANDAYADYSEIVRKLPAHGSEEPFKGGGAAANDMPQEAMNLIITPAPSYSALNSESNSAYNSVFNEESADATLAPIFHNEPQGALTPEFPYGTSPSHDGDPQGNDPQGGDINHAQPASPIPTQDDIRATPSPSPTAVIAAPEKTPPTAEPAPPATPAPQATPAQNSPIDFDALKAINSNAVAWLYSPNTAIDYPVMRTENYSYYLDRLPDGRKNANGSLFIDYNNTSDFSGALTVIYGHNMKSGKMFGSLPSYKSQSYFNQHPFMYLYTERRSYRLDLIYGCTIGEGQWRERAFMYAENIASLISYASHYTTFKSGTSYKSGDRVVVLSTCTFEFNDARYVVLGVLRGI